MQANVMSQWNGDRKHDHVVEEEEEGEEEGATSGSLMEENIDIDTDTHRALKRHRKHETTSDSSFQVGSIVPLVVDSAPRLGMHWLYFYVGGTYCGYLMLPPFRSVCF